jgi:alpha-beta hydrolase superfamily lysophospholipase
MTSTTTATTTHAESLARVQGLQANERADPRLNPSCYSVVLEHGQRMPRAIVLLHGFTSSPVQFRDLGAAFHDRGYNVLIPRMPGHGYRNRLTRDHGKLRAADYKAYASNAVESARGMGEHLSVAGLSVSGVLAAWCAQTRQDVDLAVPISPSFAPAGVPLQLVPILSRLTLRLPNLFMWWDIRKRQAVGTTCSNPRFSTHGLAEAFLFGYDEVYRAAARHAPVARSILSVTNAGDASVNNAAPRALVRRWREHSSTSIREYEFTLHSLHDIIGPYQPNARVDYVYPILLDLVDASA